MFALLMAAALAALPSPEAQPSPAPPFVLSPATEPPSSAEASPSPSPAASLPPCSTVKIALLDSISSKTAQPGEPFRFHVTSIDDHARIAFPTVVLGSDGWGVVAVIQRGRTGGLPGFIVLEPRFIIGSDGAHVPATLAHAISLFYSGKSHNSPAGVGLIPFVGIFTSPYDAFHKGGDVTVGPSDTLTLLLGDGADAGGCSPPTTPP